MSWKHDDLANDLADALLTDKRMVWTDMQLGPSGSPRPDVYTIEKSYTSPVPTAYEIKISRSDFLSDVTSGKWIKYRRYAGAVIFATPRGLIDKKELPAGCGLMVRGEHGWRTLRRPTRESVQLPQMAVLKLLIDGCERARRAKEIAPRSADAWVVAERVRKVHGRRVAEILMDHERAEERLRGERNQHDAIIKSLRATQQQVRERTQAERDEIAADLCKFLGLEEWNKFAAARRVREMRQSLDADSRVQISDQAVKNAEGAIRRALDQIRTVHGSEDAA